MKISAAKINQGIFLWSNRSVDVSCILYSTIVILETTKVLIMSERMVKCPFNSQHIMSPSSLQRHIIRCMVNYPNHVVCPYNAMHRFRNKDLLADHMLQCESKVKAYIIEETHDYKQEACYHIDKVRNFNLEHENWDED